MKSPDIMDQQGPKGALVTLFQMILSSMVCMKRKDSNKILHMPNLSWSVGLSCTLSQIDTNPAI